MEYICSCVRSCFAPIIPPCILDTVCADFDSDSPLCGGRCDIYWRDNVMIFGLALDIAGLAYAIFIGSTFFIFITATLALVTCFAMYYVSRYAEQRTMQEQLTTLQHNVFALTHNTIQLTRISNANLDQLDQFKAQNKELSTTASRLEAVTNELETLRSADQRLKEAERQYYDILKRIQNATALDETIRNQLSTETNRLSEVRKDIDASVKNLENASRMIVDNTQRQQRILIGRPLIAATATATPTTAPTAAPTALIAVTATAATAANST